jgi:thiol-disulfide isomerase/thioredoxin
MFRYRKLIVIVSLAALLGGSLVIGQEQRPPARQPQAVDNRFTVPKTDDVAELVKFIERVRNIRVGSRAEAEELQSKGLPAVQQAARRIVELEKDTKSDAYRLARRVVLSDESQKVARDGEPGQQKVMLDELVKFIRDGEQTAEDLQIAVNFGSTLEFEGDKNVAAEAYTKLGTLFAEHRDEQLARYGRIMQGAARRLNLVGQPMKLTGTTLDGQPFDLQSLRGKVVLVDFWATWCGPCLQEHPNIEKQYKTYKDKGFEVVGVSIDDNRQALENFVEQKDIPWITLHDKENRGQHPATIDYGILGIPAMMLVGKDGKVVSTSARGAELARLLDEMLGGEK